MGNKKGGLWAAHTQGLLMMMGGADEIFCFSHSLSLLVSLKTRHHHKTFPSLPQALSTLLFSPSFPPSTLWGDRLREELYTVEAGAGWLWTHFFDNWLWLFCLLREKRGGGNGSGRKTNDPALLLASSSLLFLLFLPISPMHFSRVQVMRAAAEACAKRRRRRRRRGDRGGGGEPLALSVHPPPIPTFQHGDSFMKWLLLHT